MAASTNNLLITSATNGVAFATANGGATWATFTTGTPNTIGALATYATDEFTTATNNVDVTVNGSPAAFTVNTLRFNTDNVGLTLAGTNIINTGGILVTPNAGANGVTIGGTGYDYRQRRGEQRSCRLQLWQTRD